MSNISPTEQELSIINAMAKKAGVVKSARKSDLIDHYKAGHFDLDTVSAYIETQRAQRPHWFGERAGDDPTKRTNNPWSAAAWNITEQGRLVKTLGLERAAQLATAAGVKIGATKPARAA